MLLVKTPTTVDVSLTGLHVVGEDTRHGERENSIQRG